MDVLVEVGRSMVHERIDVVELDVVCSLKVPELIAIKDDVGSPLIVLMRWTLFEALSNDVLEVKVCIQDRAGKGVVDVQDVH